VSSPEIHELAFDDENEEELGRHGITPGNIEDILAGGYSLVRNKRRRRGLYKIIGKDRGGRIVTVIVEPTRKRTVWRPVTGWPSTRGEITQFEG
jgi:uncharacterized DUF497 family protein